MTQSYQNKPVSVILKDLGRFFDVHFAGAFADTALRTTLKLRNATIEEALTRLLEPFHYRFRKEGKMYSLKYSDEYIQFVTGIVRSKQGKGLENIYVTIAGTTTTTTTNSEGEFNLQDVPAQAILEFSGVNTIIQRRKLDGDTYLHITLEQKIDLLSEIVLKARAHNGFDTTRKINPGAYSYLDLSSNKRATATITGVLENSFTGIAFEQDKLQIRTLSTILANRSPLIILDGIPYEGDINSIQPNEIEDITVLKDATATAPWGVRAGNGAIVIQRKKSKFNQPFTTEFTSEFLITPKIDLYKDPTRLPSDQFIEAEIFQFHHGHYNDALSDDRKPASLVAQILYDHTRGRISQARADQLLDSLRKNDVTKDLSNHYYRDNLVMQYGLNASGSDSNNAYHLFAGYNTTTTGRTRNGREQYILNADNRHRFRRKAIELFTSVRATLQKDKNNNPTDPAEVYPYTLLADANGHPLSITKENKESYLERPELARLMDWKYRPLDELRLADHTTRTLHLIADAVLQYSINKHFSAKAYTRVERKVNSNRNFRSIDSWFTRNLINKFTQINGNTITYGVPRGNILDKGDQQYNCENLGLQLKYITQWDSTKGRQQQLNVIVGGDLKIANTRITGDRLYGYVPEQESSVIPNFVKDYIMFGTTTVANVPDMRYAEVQNENHSSGYIIVNYVYDNQFAVTGSLREDHTNVFGWKANARFSPLYSGGLGWVISSAPFYHLNIPYLKLSVTQGTSGNTYRLASGQPTIYLINDYQNNQTIAIPVAPANPNLRYEKSTITNFGLSVEILKNRFTIDGDYYIKKGTDLFGKMRIDPGTGYRDLLGNYAEMKGKGMEWTISFSEKWGKLSWKSALGYNYVTDKITRYQGSLTTVGDHLSINQPTPLEGHSLNTVYSTKTMGLDNSGQLKSVDHNGSANDYNAILQSTDLERYLNDEGASVPRHFGFFTNTFSWKDISFRINMNFKLKYVLRKPSINYNELFNNRVGHKDFGARWKNRGDEFTTIIPAMSYPVNQAAGAYFNASDVLIEKGDHIRLQDLILSWRVNKRPHQWLPCKQMQLTTSVSNVCLLWRANKAGIDPDNPLGYSLPPTYLFSIQIIL